MFLGGFLNSENLFPRLFCTMRTVTAWKVFFVIFFVFLIDDSKATVGRKFKKKRSGAKFHRSRHSGSEHDFLTDSLRIRREQACEGSKLQLQCPAHTQILVESTFFGRTTSYNEICSPSQVLDLPNDVTSSPSLWDARYADLSCEVTNAHSKVVELCQYKRKCKVLASADVFDRNPCPTTLKYLQVAYKCKPSQFNSENFCDETTMQLSCKGHQRLAILSATYGRTVANNPGECAGGAPTSYDCTLDVLPNLLRICHAQAQCSLVIGESTFGDAQCGAGVRKYLNVVSNCVQENVFNDRVLSGHYGSEESSFEIPYQPPSPSVAVVSTTLSTQNDASINGIVDPDSRPVIPDVGSPSVGRGDAAFPNLSGTHNGVQEKNAMSDGSPLSTPRCLPESAPNAVLQLQNWMSTYKYVRENQEKFFLYFGLSASTGVIALLAFCIVQLYWRQRGQQNEAGVKSDLSEKFSASHTSSKMEITANQTSTGFDENRVEMSDFGRDGVSFLRFNHPTPPRSAPPAPIAASSFPAQFYS